MVVCTRECTELSIFLHRQSISRSSIVVRMLLTLNRYIDTYLVECPLLQQRIQLRECCAAKFEPWKIIEA